jgi:hypothetical protein
VLKELVARQEAGLPLPGLQFFKPGAEFIAWMVEQFAGRKVYEIGAGQGHTARALAEAGLEVEAFDLHGRTGRVYRVVSGNGASYPYQPDSVGLICRPCHGPFVQATIEHLVESGAAAIVYVGLRRNAVSDLAVFRRWFRVALEQAGADSETVYVWQRKERRNGRAS